MVKGLKKFLLITEIKKPHDLELEQIRRVSLRGVFNQIYRNLTGSEIFRSVFKECIKLNLQKSHMKWDLGVSLKVSLSKTPISESL